MVKILIVEDNEDNLYLLEFLLKRNGYDVIIARDGLEAVKKAINEKPNIILMDIQLPRMNGYEATKEIREKGLKDIPIIAVTSYAMSKDRQKCMDAGCTDYLEKPINPETFFQFIEKFI